MIRNLIAITLFACIWLQCLSAAATPPPGAKDKCPVCGMFVSKYPAWTASVSFRDGSHAYFDGAKDLFTFLQNVSRYISGKTAAMVTVLQVKDYYSLQMIDAKTAYYVTGSNVYGPMGHELVPFAKQSDAQEFLKDHQGKRIVRSTEITPALLKTLE